MAPVAGLQEGDVSVGGVGHEALEAVPVDVGEGELGAGVGILTAGDRAFPRTDVMLGDGQFLADEKYLFQRFRELLLGDEVLRAEPGRAGSALDVLLRQLYDKAESNEQESIIHAPVDQARIESFKDALLGAWTAEGTLRLLLEQVKWGPAISVSAAQNNEPDPYGLNILTPKDYFAETRSHADPKELGRELARSLLRTEEATIVAEILSKLRRRDVDDGHLAQFVRRKVKALRRKGQAPCILILNSWEIAQILRSSKGSVLSAEADAGPVEEFEGAPMIRQYSPLTGVSASLLTSVAWPFSNSPVRWSFDLVTN